MSRNSLDSRFLLPAFTTRLIRFDDVFFVFFFLLYKEKDEEREKTLVGNRRNREVI